jgi:peptide/nickel transport system permease protein
LGLIIGAASAFFGRWVDGIAMRLADTVLSFPHLLLAMFIVGTIRMPIAKWLDGIGFDGDGSLIDYLLVFGALAAVGWAGEARLVRSQVLTLRRTEFVTAAKALGAEDRRIIRVHIVPNALGPLIVSASASFGGAMLSESSLSFLGVGIKPPGASWGNMISENLATWRYEPHLLAMPGIVLAISVLAFNFIGDGVNDALNPRSRRQH